MNRLLLVEDDKIVVGAIKGILADAGYCLIAYEDGEAAWRHLVEQPSYDAILLDRQLPGLDGLGLLRRIKQDAAMKHIPVIMETFMDDEVGTRDCLAAGAYYYLNKPLQPKVLLAVLEAALRQDREARELSRLLKDTQCGMRLLVDGTFRARTLEDIQQLALILAQAFPNPLRAILGLVELLTNAVEHGNLGISYDDKTWLVIDNNWHEEVQRRLADPVLGQRLVTVELTRRADALSLTIRDEGEGFDWHDYLEISPKRLFDPHGRGIAMARLQSFNSLEYQGNGNTVVVGAQLA